MICNPWDKHEENNFWDFQMSCDNLLLVLIFSYYFYALAVENNKSENR